MEDLGFDFIVVAAFFERSPILRDDALHELRQRPSKTVRLGNDALRLADKRLPIEWVNRLNLGERESVSECNQKCSG